MQTYTEAQCDLSTLLREARRVGAVRIHDMEGHSYLLQTETGSPLDVPGVAIDLSAGEIVRMVREGRER